MEHEIDI